MIRRLRDRLAKVSSDLRHARRARDRQRKVIDKLAPHDPRRAAHHKRVRVLTQRIKWRAKRQTVLRRKLKAAKAKAHPEFEAWMTGGHSQQVTDAVKKEIAIGVVRFDLYVTSTADGQPGDGRHTPTSLHYRQNNADGKGHAVDIAGARMATFQRARHRDPGPRHYQELFGPDNDAWAKNGLDTSGLEGSALEQLHDTHCHDAPYS